MATEPTVTVALTEKERHHALLLTVGAIKGDQRTASGKSCPTCDSLRKKFARVATGEAGNGDQG